MSMKDSMEAKWGIHYLEGFDNDNGLIVEANDAIRPLEEANDTDKTIGEGEDNKPKIGMVFDTLEVAWDFWKKYGESVGFGVRKMYSNRSKKDDVIIDVVYVCCKQGKRQEDKRRTNSVHRWETRSQCQVKLSIVFDRQNQKYMVKKFVEQHNHELEPPETRHMLRSHRKVGESYALAIELASDAGLTPRATHELLCKEAGGRAKLGFIMEDQRTYLRSKREKNMAYGELGNIVKYFEEQKMRDPGFFYSMQFDNEELVTNILWADSRMIVDYCDFGDVITFDTTYGTNKELRPLGAFVGFNHHRKMVIFGSAFMYDETTESFIWLFETFLKAHGGKRPQTIFTDQDVAMIKALENVWPNTKHGLCSWHLMQNGIKHLGWRMKEGSIFLIDFKKCMFEYGDEIQFEKEWKIMLDKHNLKDNNWICRTYSLKEKWARCYMKYARTLGIRSTQLSESLNSDLKDYLKCDLSITDFFKQFDRVVEQKREKVLEAEFRARQRVPLISDSPLLQQASQRYTPQIFEDFQIQLRRALRVIFKMKNETQTPHEYVVCPHDSKDREFIVLYDSSNDVISCSCRKFERMGILCSHTLKVYICHDVMDIPEKYIAPRWTRGFKSSHFLTKVIEDDKEDASQWVRRMQSQLLRMTLQASIHEVTQRSMEKMAMEFSKELFEFTTQNVAVDKENVAVVDKENIAGVDKENMGNLKGLKKKQGLNRTRRPKPLHEINRRKRKRSKTDHIEREQSRELGEPSSQTLQPSVELHSPWPLQFLNYPQHGQCLAMMENRHMNMVCDGRMPLQNLNFPYHDPSSADLHGGH